MPFIYDPRIRGSGYRDAVTGRIISRHEVLEQVEVMISRSDDVVTALTQMLGNRTISLDTWHQVMRQEIKDNYITQYLAGRGGRGKMTPTDWGSIGGMVAEQYKYLSAFRDEIASGDLSLGQIRVRASMYLNSSREAFERAQQRAVLEAEIYKEHAWVMAEAADHCDDCVDLARLGWQPIDEPFISPSTGVETVPGAGDTICLTNCKCHLEYR